MRQQSLRSLPAHPKHPRMMIRTYAKVHAVGAIHELPLRENKGFSYYSRKS
ncbi:hypothetical protein KBT16_19045 [Nostoc sp. CCCryo 231-06]|nr:hypothetical protein [Nostoc sp. CCCryo 231-06]